MKLRILVPFWAIISLYVLMNNSNQAVAQQYNSSSHSTVSYTERDREFRELEQQRHKSVNRRGEANQAVQFQLREDFSRLYELQQSQLLPTSPTLALDNEMLMKSTEEIRTRASRIRRNLLLMLAERDEKKKKEYAVTESDLRPSASELRALIVRFVNSPVFQVNSPNDKELRIVAREDLETIIKLSDSLNKAARKLTKAAIP
jgi:hypothetical protein